MLVIFSVLDAKDAQLRGNSADVERREWLSKKGEVMFARNRMVSLADMDFARISMARIVDKKLQSAKCNQIQRGILGLICYNLNVHL